jgi:hypothetical protein
MAPIPAWLNASRASASEEVPQAGPSPLAVILSTRFGRVPRP